MRLPPNDFNDYEAVTSTSVKFLKYLKLDENSEFQEIRFSLQYLDSITLQANDELPDVQDFAQHLFDVSYKLQTEYLNRRLGENSERLAEVFQEELENLFNTLPPELRTFHNLTLEALLKPEKNKANTIDSTAIETLKQSITPEALAEAETPQLSSTLLDKLKSKAKLTPKQVVQVLAACAMLSLPSDKVQRPAGPEIMARMPDALAQSVKFEVGQQLSFNFSAPTPSFRLVPPPQLQVPAQDRAFEVVETIPYPQALVKAQRENGVKRVGMNDRFSNAMLLPHKRELFYDMHHNGQLDPLVSILAMVESNIDPDAESKSGAMGMMQDMGALQGAFGDPKTLAFLTKHGLMPQIDNKYYQKALKNGPIPLINFLKREKANKTEFWTNFLISQKKLIKSPETSQRIAHYYIQSLRLQSTKLTGINDPSHTENQYIAAMGYNAGMGNIRLLKRIMSRNKVETFTTNSALSFLNQTKPPAGIRLKKRIYDEALDYVARTIGMFEIVAEVQAAQPPTT